MSDTDEMLNAMRIANDVNKKLHAEIGTLKAKLDKLVEALQLLNTHADWCRDIGCGCMDSCGIITDALALFEKGER